MIESMPTRGRKRDFSIQKGSLSQYLTHPNMYPVSEDTDIPQSHVKLKGRDLTLLGAFRSAGIKGEIRALYEDIDPDSDEEFRGR